MKQRALAAIFVFGLNFSPVFSHAAEAELGKPSIWRNDSPDLPPWAVVAEILRSAPAIAAAEWQVKAEDANRQKLAAGNYEWTLRAGTQRRRVMSSVSNPEAQFREWDVSLEKAWRLPGKAKTDQELGEQGLAVAQTALGDARHETARHLLGLWFNALREQAVWQQWQAQVALLQKQTHAVQRRQSLGDASRLERIQAEAALAQAEAQAKQANTKLQLAELALSQRYPALRGKPLPAQLSTPQAVTGDLADWVAEILEHNHELQLAQGRSKLVLMQAKRVQQDLQPDPSFGLQSSRERGGEERVLGIFVSVPLPGAARHANSEAAQAHANAIYQEELAVRQKVTAEASSLYQTAQTAWQTWQDQHTAAARLSEAADLTARAYQLGEGSLSDLLQTRRQAHEAHLQAHLTRLEALEASYRLALDGHRIWGE